MKRFEYEITQHPADTFEEVVYFCTDSGSGADGSNHNPREDPKRTG